jgi:hypothetical protein
MYPEARLTKPVSRLATKTSRVLAGFLALMLVFGAGIYGAIRFMVPESANAPVVTEAFDVQAVRSFKISSLTYAYSDFIYDPDAIELPVVKANLPFSKSHLGIEYKGKMEIGIDASKLKVTENDKVITIVVPKAEILSHEIVGTPEILFNISGLFNRNTPEEVLPLVFEVGKPKVEKNAIEYGYLQTAQTLAADQLKSFVESLYSKDGYTVIVRNA